MTANDIGKDIWILDQREPRCANLIAVLDTLCKCVVKFHGVIEVVDMQNCYKDESSCNHAAWMAELERGELCLDKARKYKERHLALKKKE